MNRFSTLALAAAAPAVPPALWPPQAPTIRASANAHPGSAHRRDLPINPPSIRDPAATPIFMSWLHVQQQMLPLPGTDDLCERLVLGLLDGGVGEHETIPEQIDEGLGFPQQAQGLRQGTRQRYRKIICAARDRFGRPERFGHAEI